MLNRTHQRIYDGYAYVCIFTIIIQLEYIKGFHKVSQISICKHSTCSASKKCIEWCALHISVCLLAITSV